MSWLVDTMIATGALIALVLVLRRPVASRFGPGTAYALWILPMLRLLLPPLVLPAQPAPMVVAAAEAGPVLQITSTVPPATAWGIVAPLLQAVWLAGALGFLVWRIWSYAAMRHHLLAGASSVGEADGVRLVESPVAHSPMAFGIIDKVVALPPGFISNADTKDRDLAIAHELEHHAGRDLIANLAMQPLLALHWFNPLAWAGWRAMRRDQEAACDARVLAGRDNATRAAYANLIASFAAAPRPSLAASLACPVVAEKNIIYRLRSLTMTQPSLAKRRFGRMLLGIGVLALPLTASISHATQDAPPAPPPVPAAPAASAASAAPAAPHQVQKIMIVESNDAADPKLHTQTITRGGRTYVLRTKTPLSDAEVQQKVDEIEKGVRIEGDAIMMTPNSGQGHSTNIMVIGAGANSGGGAPDQDDTAPQRREVSTFVMSGNTSQHSITSADGGGFTSAQCGEGKPFVAQVSRADGDKQERAQVTICSVPGKATQNLAALRHTRDRMAADTHLSPDTKSEILRQIDAEIAKLEKEV